MFVFQIIFYEDRNFQGRYYESSNDFSDLHTYVSRCNSIKVLGGFWVVYEKPNYMGHQYVLSPGEYPDYQYWLGINDAVRSCRVVRHVSGFSITNNTNEPLLWHVFRVDFLSWHSKVGNTWRMKIWEKPNFEGESVQLSDNMPTFHERWQSRDVQSCKVFEGAWIFYEHPNYRGRQYLLEKGEYRRYSEWGGRQPNVGSVRRVKN